MRKPFRCLGAVALAAIAVGGLGACGLGPATTFKDDAALTQKVTSVRIDNTNGAVTLRGKQGATTVSVHRTVEYRGNKPQGASHRVEGGELVLGGCGSRCSVSYTVDVPAGLAVKGRTTNGAIKLTRVGAVQVSTSSGRVDLEGVSGAVDVRTSNGRVTGRDLKGGSIAAESSNGAIDLATATRQNVRAKTSNGKVTLTVPSGAYQVLATTDNGDKNIGVTQDPAAKYRLEATTSNGGITIKNP